MDDFSSASVIVLTPWNGGGVGPMIRPMGLFLDVCDIKTESLEANGLTPTVGPADQYKAVVDFGGSERFRNDSRHITLEPYTDATEVPNGHFARTIIEQPPSQTEVHSGDARITSLRTCCIHIRGTVIFGFSSSYVGVNRHSTI